MTSKYVSALLILLLLVLARTAAADPVVAPRADEVRTGRSVAVKTAPAHEYWLSRDLNRLFLQSAAPAAERPETPSH